MKELKIFTEFWPGNHKMKDNVEDLEAEGRIILKCI